MGHYKRAAEKVRERLDLHFDADGRCILDLEDVRFYPKAPYLLHAVGLRTKGARAVEWVFKHFIDSSGDLMGPGAQENRLYGMGWLLLGAVAVERFDLAQVLGDRLCQQASGSRAGPVDEREPGTARRIAARRG